ncbi:MAG: recombinase family protein [Bacteroidales bacterium]
MRRTIPLGYEIRDGKAVIHEGEGKMVRYAFEAYCKGYSQFTIAKVFQEAGYKNGNGRVSWSQSTIGKLLCNRVYLEDDFYPQLITQEIFDKAAQVRNEKAVHQKRYRNDDYEYREPLFAFSAKLFCEICSCTFYRFQVKVKDEGYLAVWKCRNFKEHNEKGLPRTNMYESEIEDIFIGLLHELAKDLRPLFYKPVEQQIISSDIKEFDKEISELLSTTKSALENKDHINELIAKRAYLQYERSVIDDFDYQTGKIKRILADKDLMDKTFDAEFFRGVIEKVTLKKDGLLCFRFLNGFEITKKYERKVGVKNGSKEC